MTDPFHPAALHVIAAAPIARADSEPALEFLTGPALQLLIAERIEQIERHGFTPEHDAYHDSAELAAAALCYLGTYLEIATNPDFSAARVGTPAHWPWAPQDWKEPTPDEDGKVKALTKAAALILAELDRVLSAQMLLRAARPLAEPVQPSPPDGLGLKRASDLLPKERTCRHCGCTETAACENPITGAYCYWVFKDVCSECAHKEPR